MAQSVSGALQVGAGQTSAPTTELIILIFLELAGLVALRWFSRNHHGG